MVDAAVPMHWRRFDERYRLAGSHCKNCGEYFFPKRMVCPNCRRKGKLSTVEMPREGKIISFTEVFVGPSGFENETPYFIAIIELLNKAKILAQIVDSPREKINTGAKVKKVFRKIADHDAEGAIAYGYKFKVV
ncbi:MAG: Zn-ribbon domain-containing OB-fold protein [archaeon]|nr:Zn-ribbon domain-containing OB-fold protein [archaeon]